LAISTHRDEHKNKYTQSDSEIGIHSQTAR